MAHAYFVYILASRSRVLYVGVTGNLLLRMHQHRTHAVPGSAARYRVTRLVDCEQTSDIASAIGREKQIKGWLRCRKIALIESENPRWDDLAADWFENSLPLLQTIATARLTA